jgi:hypothetical protein
VNLRELLLQFAGEEEKKLKEEEEQDEKRTIISDGFHIEELHDSILKDTEEENESQ